jgi:hypothetical protein
MALLPATRFFMRTQKAVESAFFQQRPDKRLEYRGFLKMLQVVHWRGFTPIDLAQVLAYQPLMASRFSSGF